MKPQLLPKALTVAECSALIEATKHYGLETWALTELAYASGARLGELLGLKIGDLDLERLEARVTGKGKTRLVLMGEPCAYALVQWLAERERASESDCRGLESHSQHPDKVADASTNTNTREIQQSFFASHVFTLPRRTYQWRLAQAGHRALGKHVTPHHLRHSFVTSMLDGGADLLSTMSLAGHEKVDTTGRYWAITGRKRHVLARSVVQAMARAHKDTGRAGAYLKALLQFEDTVDHHSLDPS